MSLRHLTGTRSWTTAVVNGIRWMGIVYMVLSMIPALALLHGRYRGPEELRLGVIGLELVGVAIIVALFARIRGDLLLLGITIVSVGAQYVMVRGMTHMLLFAERWPQYLVIAIMVCITLASTGWRRLLCPALIWGSGALMRIVLTPDAPGLWTVLGFEAFQVAGIIPAAILISGGLLDCGVEADEITNRLRLRHAREEGARQLAREREAAERFVHDTVVHALRAVALPSHVVSAEKARAYSQQAILARQDKAIMADAEPLGVALQAVADEAPVYTSVTGDRLVLPCAETVAITTAAREALRNVKLHAGVDEAQITVEKVPGGGAQVTITDRGVGASTTSPYGHRGIRDVIIGGMHAVGGFATVEAKPGEGTTVVLQWRPAGHAPSRTTLLTEISLRARRALNLGPLPWLMAMFGLTMFLSLHGLNRPPLLVAATMVLVAGLTIALRNLSTMAQSTAFILWLIATSASLINLFELPLAGAVDFQYPLGTAGAGLLTLVIFFRPLREGIVAVVGYIAVTFGLLTARLGLAAAFPEFLPSVCGQLLALAMALTLRLVVDGIGEDAQATHDEDAARASQAQAAEVTAEAQARMRRLNPTNAFLRRVANGALDPEELTVKNQAHLLELSLRDELHLHGPVPSDVANLLWQLRASGWQVTLNLGLADLNRNIDAISNLLTAAQDNVAGKLTVSVREDLVVLLAVPALSDEHPDLPAGANVSHNADFSTWSLPAEPDDALDAHER